ncbi:integral membrane sensor signal transduction histidine kinase [Arcobacter nitrofigilis DSM 7299]|uniref:histidine kinase n=1 Tax=Arcobacter nitrofigilis (strain ATCC 33309 / DSM 7299 / CCUG 15893 / LMG 7604 / NCTC 12251 / CI) TaxID=572480 RepID=D5V1Y1_ARCNC|nr:integral membrane sensor signal transduction histidine kinase [Arcobacter nitrofigilis DSM 7299]
MLKSLDIDLPQSEKKTLWGFLTLYSVLCIVILLFISFLYYNFKKDLMLQNKRLILQEYSNDLISRLKDLHINFDKYKFYPRDERFNSAIYDSDRNLIFSTLISPKVKLDEITYTTNNYIHYIKEPESYYLGAKYVLLEIPEDKAWINDVRNKVTIFLICGFSIMFICGYFLLKLFLRPMRDSLHLLDRFIKDTTHELNTPISAIITNIEMIDIASLEDVKLQKKLKRIDTGAKTVSNIYQDLTYLALKNKIISKNEDLDLSKIVLNRIDYFKTLADVKKISFIKNINSGVKIFCDEKKIGKVVDNLLSNAIKYNKISGSIEVILENKKLIIKDSGKGIQKDKIPAMFERYARFDKSVGGFGIGLNIVYMITKEYNIDIKIKSELNIGTQMELTW